MKFIKWTSGILVALVIVVGYYILTDPETKALSPHFTSASVTPYDNFDWAFNATARRLHLAVRLEIDSCSRPRQECVYTFGKVRVTVRGDSDLKRTIEAGFEKTSSDPQDEWDEARNAMFAVFSPDVSDAERERLLAFLASGGSRRVDAPDVFFRQTTTDFVATEIRRRKWERVR